MSVVRYETHNKQNKDAECGTHQHATGHCELKRIKKIFGRDRWPHMQRPLEQVHVCVDTSRLIQGQPALSRQLHRIQRSVRITIDKRENRQTDKNKDKYDRLTGHAFHVPTLYSSGRIWPVSSRYYLREAFVRGLFCQRHDLQVVEIELPKITLKRPRTRVVEA